MAKLPARGVEAGYRLLKCGGAKWNPSNALSGVNDASRAVDETRSEDEVRSEHAAAD